MDKYVISVGAGNNQVPLIIALNQKGYKVISFDKSDKAPGRLYSHRFTNISTWNYNHAINWLNSLKLEYSGVLCFSYGKAIVTQKHIADFFNLPCRLNCRCLQIQENKFVLRQILKNNKLSNLEEYIYDNDFQYAYTNTTSKKYIIKDIHGCSSSNINIVDSSNVKQVLETGTRNGNMILQEFIDGEEYRIISIIKDRVVSFLAVLSKGNLTGTPFTARLKPLAGVHHNFQNLVYKLIHLFDINDTVLKLDLIRGEKTTEILEVDFSIGGDFFENHICPVAYEYNFIDNYINLMLGLEIETQPSLVNTTLCFDYIYNIEQNKMVKIEYKNIEQKLNGLLGNIELIKIKQDGSLIGYPSSNLDAICAVIHKRPDVSNLQINRLINNNIF